MDAYIAGAVRTPIGRSHREKGIFRNIRADELLGQLMAHFTETLVPASAVDDILVGCVGQHLEQGKNIARLSALLANLPESVPGVTINRLCGSSLSAFNFGAVMLECGGLDVVLAGGVEHMHHVPMTAAVDYHPELLGRYDFPFNNMGLTAENVAEKYGITRREQDLFALESHRKALAARKKGYFRKEIKGIETDSGFVAEDQCPREDTDLARLCKLPGIFRSNGTVTAGNSSPLADGASLTCLATGEGCQRLGLPRRARVLGFSVVGVDPTIMGTGPVAAVKKVLKRFKMETGDIDLFELNEAFSSQAVACIRELSIPEEKVNPGGGAIALGHPLGSTGTRLITTLVHNLERMDRETGIATMCIGHGQGIATLIRRVEP